MLRLIAFLWTGCWHKWTIHETWRVFTRGHERPTAQTYVLRCDRCGQIKDKQVNF